MDKKENNNEFESSKKAECNVMCMPPLISDEDITALFNGLIGVVRKKVELESRSEIINMNISYQKLLKELKEKQAECTRLKNELLYYKSKQ